MTAITVGTRLAAIANTGARMHARTKREDSGRSTALAVISKTRGTELQAQLRAQQKTRGRTEQPHQQGFAEKQEHHLAVSYPKARNRPISGRRSRTFMMASTPIHTPQAMITNGSITAKILRIICLCLARACARGLT